VCWFITIAVSEDRCAVVDARLASHRALHFTAVSSTPTAKVFRAGSHCIEVTHGGCSCDLYAEKPSPDRVESKLARERQRLVRKGWSSSKVERALKAKSESEARPRHTHAAAGDFNTLVSELVADLGSVELFAHFYSGDPREEVVGFPERASLSLSQFLETGFPPNTVATVSGAAG
jgi:hypothetical protein